MALDVLSIAIGLVLGGVSVAVVIEVMGRGRQKPVQQEKLTSAWRLSELHEPVLVARDVMDVDVPAKARVYASGLVDPRVQQTCRVFQVPPVNAEFALDLVQRRAILFVGGVRKDALALMTVDETLVARLEAEYKRMADRSNEYVERFRIQDLGGRNGVTIETEGIVQDALPWKGRFMIRLEDQGHIIGVLVNKDPSSLQDKRIRVKGVLKKDETGYPVVDAIDLRTMG